MARTEKRRYRDRVRYPRASDCPKEVAESLQRYTHKGIPTGGFLQSVLENDLAQAVARADGRNLQALPDIIAWVWEFLPSAAWGSPEKVKAWLAGPRTREPEA